jgi:flavodoxin
MLSRVVCGVVGLIGFEWGGVMSGSARSTDAAHKSYAITCLDYTMKSIVVYYSKTGNTKYVADYIAKGLECKVLPVNLMDKKGSGTKEERSTEKELYNNAIKKSVNCTLAVIGTPTGFQKAKSMIQRFVRDVQADTVALFCTHDNKIGTTLADLEDILTERGIEVIHTMSLGLFKPGEFSMLEEPRRSDYLDRINDFVELCKVGRTRDLTMS